ncbi:MAG: prepilin-type N-terminal cleavage/methylation domain-containing protein [Acidobacteria bacterium]|nr:prepilin-type N-terminal cleavage/methylation domain-containing protein [Acidobacteriota bacterium]
MERSIQIGKARRSGGMTLIELMIVLTIIITIISVAVPLYQKAIIRAKESVLKNNLFTLRTLIDEYTFDKEKAPQSLQDLVTEGYLREVPLDPFTKSRESWKVEMEDAVRSVDQKEPGIIDVHSGSDGKALDGSKYADW